MSNMYFGATPFTAEQPAQSIHPHYLSVYVSADHFGSKLLISQPQHSILGSWLAITQAGFPPAR